MHIIMQKVRAKKDYLPLSHIQLEITGVQGFRDVHKTLLFKYNF